jgi:hypothetical protein
MRWINCSSPCSARRRVQGLGIERLSHGDADTSCETLWQRMTEREETREVLDQELQLTACCGCC